MLRTLSLLSFIVATSACRTAPVELSQPTAQRRESRATEMPESLRCRVAEDCTLEPNCYWAEPKCVAAASVVAQQCGSDADPPDAARTPVTCGCQAGQCVPSATK